MPYRIEKIEGAYVKLGCAIKKMKKLAEEAGGDYDLPEDFQ